MIHCASPTTKALEENGKSHNDAVESYHGLFSLVGHDSADSSIGLFWLIVSAVFHLRTLQTTGYFGAKSRKDVNKTDIPLTQDELMIGTLLVHILQLLRYNTHSVIVSSVLFLPFSTLWLFWVIFG
jgi:hypothetical protein